MACQGRTCWLAMGGQSADSLRLSGPSGSAWATEPPCQAHTLSRATCIQGLRLEEVHFKLTQDIWGYNMCLQSSSSVWMRLCWNCIMVDFLPFPQTSFPPYIPHSVTVCFRTTQHMTRGWSLGAWEGLASWIRWSGKSSLRRWHLSRGHKGGSQLCKDLEEQSFRQKEQQVQKPWDRSALGTCEHQWQSNPGWKPRDRGQLLEGAAGSHLCMDISTVYP